MSTILPFVRRHPRQLALAFAAAVVVAALLLSLALSDSGASPVSTTGPTDIGTLTIGDMTYAFRPETCFVGENSFVGSGTGAIDGVPYRVAASPSVVEITFGVVEEGASVPPGARWLQTNDVVQWDRHDSEVVADVELFERSAPERSAIAGTVWLSCADEGT